MARYDKIGNIEYTRLFPKLSPYINGVFDKRVMVLSDDIGIYQKNKLAGSFLDWKLSREIFEEPDYYEHVLLVDKAIKMDPPDRIIDPNNLMNNFFERIPELQTRYKREGVIYIRKIVPIRRSEINN